MNRRQFLKTSILAAASLQLTSRGATPPPAQKPLLASYYLRAHMYTIVPRHVREDIAWMAEHGTKYVCLAVLEQDLFAGKENIQLICAEAAKRGMQVLAIPSRWGGLLAGAPKVPSLFTVTHPETWVADKQGRTDVAGQISGVISSVHHPATFAFFEQTLTELFRQHPAIAGIILDEPKGFIRDYSAAAKAALGDKLHDPAAQLEATRDFYSRIAQTVKSRWPDKLTVLFQQPHLATAELDAGAGVASLDFYGVDGRPWNEEDDAAMAKYGDAKRKVLLGAGAARALKAARRVPGRRSFILIENLNLPAAIMDVMDRRLPEVLALGADMIAYYYYPRSVEDPERAMEIIGRHLLAARQEPPA